MKEIPATAASNHEVTTEKSENNPLETDKKLLNLIAEAIVEILINQTNEGNRIHQDQPKRPV